jgi:putative SOS response-associated peptidase YedK
VCGRYTRTSGVEDLVRNLAIDEVRTEELPLRFNVAPSEPVYAVAGRRAAPGAPLQRTLGTLRWGLVPPWADGPSVGARMINARSEGIATKAAFREALVRRRCLIPADAFYEWQVQELPDGKVGKLPWAIRRADGQPMMFAGLWERWRPAAQPEAPPLRTCTIITTQANAALEAIHHRMPVVLDRSVWDRWLDPDERDVAALVSLLRPAPAEWFTAWPVSSAVNAVANDGPHLLDRLPEPPAAGHLPWAAAG